MKVSNDPGQSGAAMAKAMGIPNMPRTKPLDEVIKDALRPFAQIAIDETMMSNSDTDDQEWFRWDGAVLTVGDFRRALLAFQSISE